MIDRETCAACGDRGLYTKAARSPCILKLRLHADRTRQETEAFKHYDRRRAGIEGTISQGSHGFDLPYACYRGLAKTTLQHRVVVLALNLARLLV